MINLSQLRQLIIKPTLEDLVLYSEDAEELLVFTCAVESKGGTYLQQINGPALGIYQMEPKTYNDIWQNYINFNQSLKLQLLHNFNAPVMPDENRLIYDLRFATAMARIHYLRVKDAIPKASNTIAIYEYYKQFYNSTLGKAESLRCIREYINYIQAKM